MRLSVHVHVPMAAFSPPAHRAHRKVISTRREAKTTGLLPARVLVSNSSWNLAKQQKLRFFKHHSLQSKSTAKMGSSVELMLPSTRPSNPYLAANRIRWLITGFGRIRGAVGVLLGCFWGAVGVLSGCCRGAFGVLSGLLVCCFDPARATQRRTPSRGGWQVWVG